MVCKIPSFFAASQLKQKNVFGYMQTYGESCVKLYLILNYFGFENNFLIVEFDLVLLLRFYKKICFDSEGIKTTMVSKTGGILQDVFITSEFYFFYFTNVEYSFSIMVPRIYVKEVKAGYEGWVFTNYIVFFPCLYNFFRFYRSRSNFFCVQVCDMIYSASVLFIGSTFQVYILGPLIPVCSVLYIGFVEQFHFLVAFALLKSSLSLSLLFFVTHGRGDSVVWNHDEIFFSPYRVLWSWF